MIVVGSDLKSSKKAVNLAQKYDSLYASVGIHPHHANSLNDGEVDIQRQLTKELTTLARNKRVVAIGETGLDYHQYNNSKYGEAELDKDLQKKFFKLHIELAKKLNLPLIIHCRQSFNDLLDLLAPAAKGLERKGGFHCFEGSKKYLKKALNLGFYIGFNGLITYPAKEDLKELVKITPIDRILLETDSPFLTPEPLKGKRNEPKNIKIITKIVAKIKNISCKEIEKKNSQNARSLFKFS